MFFLILFSLIILNQWKNVQLDNKKQNICLIFKNFFIRIGIRNKKKEKHQQYTKNINIWEPKSFNMQIETWPVNLAPLFSFNHKPHWPDRSTSTKPRAANFAICPILFNFEQSTDRVHQVTNFQVAVS